MVNDRIPLIAVNGDDQKPWVYVGKEENLDLKLTNSTGRPIVLKKGSSQITVCPPVFYSSDEVEKMSVCLKDWDFSLDRASSGLLLRYTGTDGAKWDDGKVIEFSVTGARSDSQPTNDVMLVNFDGLEGDGIPLQSQTPFSLSNPNCKGNASLSDHLLVNLDSQGIIYVSRKKGTLVDAISNSLFLNIKNIGTAPLFTGDPEDRGDPKVTVQFVYGSTSAALAPANDKSEPLVGSAWRIRDANTYIDQTDGWGVKNPDNIRDPNPYPNWELTPDSGNVEILGTGSKSNVTFSFGPIVSLTPPGHTQIKVQ
ncbi:MAG: hypothetical protein KC931_15095, partial [Candidatus Omnitrophica bacterium]|nr:hypothetical protein [Candidatus Omnitrophota bacterium]